MLINAPISTFLKFDKINSRDLVNEKMKIPLNKKGKFVSFELGTKIKYKKITFNLTEIVPVFEDGLVALTSSTISLTSHFSGGTYQHYQATGQGREVILGKWIRERAFENQLVNQCNIDMNIPWSYFYRRLLAIRLK